MIRDKRLRAGAAVALFILALGVRLAGLGVIVTSDEPDWVDYSAKFAKRLLQGKFDETYYLPHPGVTTMWSGTIGLIGMYLLRGEAQGLIDFLEGVSRNPYRLTLFPPMRLPIALLTALCVIASFFLLRRIFGTKVALLGAAFFALDPFYLAHSRLLHQDALTTSFITLSLLSVALYLWGGGRQRYLFFSGVAAGLAFLSKVASLILGPFVAGVLLINPLPFPPPIRGREGERGGWKVLAMLALWGGAATLTAFAFWPALWSEPLRTLQRQAEESIFLVEKGHPQFFLGNVSHDPGLFFYPVAFVFRMTPLNLIGLVLAFGMWTAGRGEMRQRRAIAFFLTYIVLFALFVTFSQKKFDRYLLPIFPVVNFLAAWGWVGLAQAIKKALWPTLVLLSLMQAGFALPHHPYMLSYYNPLFGGAHLAPEVLLVGWGEGIDQVARYLASKENATSLKVASPYHHCLKIFFPGKTLDFRYPLLWQADYAVLYIAQVQREIPDAGIIKYFRSREPEYKVRLHGIDYAYIYPVPPFRTSRLPEIEHRAHFNFAEKIRLHGYDLPAPAQAGEAMHITFYWECLQPMSESYYLFVHLKDEKGHLIVQQDDLPVMGIFPTREWKEGDFIRDEHVISLPPFIPPGRYQLDIGWYLMGSEERLPVRDETGNFLAGANLGFISLTRPKASTSPDKLSLFSRLDADLAPEVRLLGSDPLPKKVYPGETLSFSLYWQAKQAPKASYEVALWLQDETGRKWNEVHATPAYPTSEWRQGDLWQDWRDLFIAADIPSGEYSLWAGLTGGGEIELGTLTIEERSRLFEVPPMSHPLEVSLGNKVELLGYDLAESLLKPGQTLHLTLYWRALSKMEKSYKVFTHLLDEKSKIWGQKDSFPGGGQRPTTGWLPGEIIVDHYEIEVSPEAPPGEYILEIGMYDEGTGARLPGAEGQKDQIILGKVHVSPKSW